MNSSAGFKKRALLRPASGLLSHKKQFLKIIDIGQSQPILATNIRSQVASIQEQINLLDKDKRIRAGEISFQKGYILTMKKWLKQVQVSNQKEQDDTKIMRQMGVDSYEAGFRKLWKLLSHIDLITSKITELQMIQFMTYDQMFGSMAQDSNQGQKILQKITKGGFSPSNFHLSQLILDRNRQLYSAASGLKRQSSGMDSSKGFSQQTKNETNQLIEQLRNQNSKLVQLLEQLQQNNKENHKIEQTKPVAPVSSYNNKNPETVFAQLDNKYKEQLNEMTNKINSLNRQIGQLKVHISQLQTRLKTSENQLKQYQQLPKGQKPKTGSYEQALLQEMNKMKAGFQRKIATITQQFTNKQRQMRKKQFEYKAQNDKIKWQKGLLLKKFDAITAK